MTASRRSLTSGAGSLWIRQPVGVSVTRQREPGGGPALYRWIAIRLDGTEDRGRADTPERAWLAALEAISADHRPQRPPTADTAMRDPARAVS